MERSPKVAAPGRSASLTVGGTLSETATTEVLSVPLSAKTTGKPKVRKKLLKLFALIFLAFSRSAAFSASVRLVAPAETVLVTLLAAASFFLANSPFCSSERVSLSLPLSSTATLAVSTATSAASLAISFASSAATSAAISTTSSASGLDMSVPSGTSNVVWVLAAVNSLLTELFIAFSALARISFLAASLSPARAVIVSFRVSCIELSTC